MEYLGSDGGGEAHGGEGGGGGGGGRGGEGGEGGVEKGAVEGFGSGEGGGGRGIWEWRRRRRSRDLGVAKVAAVESWRRHWRRAAVEERVWEGELIEDFGKASREEHGGK